MNLIPILPMSLAAICALAYLVLVARPVGNLRSALKTLSVAMLALVAGLGQGPGFLVAALTLCALGDWLLSRNGEPAFKAGIVAFALGHLAYIALFVTYPGGDAAWLAISPQLWMFVGLAALVAGMAAILIRDAGALKIPVLIYIPILLGMAYAALGLPEGVLVLALVSALAFVSSDLVLALETFILPKDHALLRLTPYAVWPLYWGSQVGFVVAFTHSVL